jgi:HAD superfamily hydrolase (TIGR01509 family)
MTEPVPIRAIVFDIGNVLLRFDFNIALQKLARRCTPKAAAILELIEPAKVAYESGRLTRAAFYEEIRGLVQYTGTEAEFVGAWEDIFTENEPMLALVAQLYGKLPLYLLSNTNDMHIDYILRRYPVFGLFTDAVYSHKAGASKPDAAIFEIAARQFGVRPAEALFIDDLLANVEAARAVGFRTHHYHHERHEALVKELQGLGFAGS